MGGRVVRAGWLVARGVAGILLVLIAGCAAGPGVGGGWVIPGGARTYGFAASQDAQDFKRLVARAQLHYSPYQPRVWTEFYGGRASAWYAGLSVFYPLDVRWQLKDGREFLLEGIDVRQHVEAFGRTYRVDLPFQREHREFQRLTDPLPSLIVEIADDWVVLKWVVGFVLTPVDERFPSSGLGRPYAITREEHVVATLRGRPAEGQDFDLKFEPRAEKAVSGAR